jgi:hypothetical protein
VRGSVSGIGGHWWTAGGTTQKGKSRFSPAKILGDAGRQPLGLDAWNVGESPH